MVLSLDESSNMDGLIPLRLASSQQTYIIVPRSTSSLYAPPIPPVPPKSQERPRRPGPITHLTIFPFTIEEWKKVMEEVKSLFLKRHYKQCSARSIQILDYIKYPDQIQPLFLIWISFYAASSLEHTSRSLRENSANKLPLLQQALSYYKKVKLYMQHATFSADLTILHAARQRSSSISSSIRSSVDSIFSYTSSVSSTTSSPTSPIYITSNTTDMHKHTVSSPSSSCDSGMKPAPLRIRKRMSFTLLPKLALEADLAYVGDSNLIEAFPTSPSNLGESLSTSFDAGTSSFLLSRSLARYQNLLAGLHAQLNYHITSVSIEIAALHSTRKPRRSNLPNLFTNLSSEGLGVTKEEMRKIDLRSRIARLKDAGWKKERFDGEKYRKICDQALAELR